MWISRLLGAASRPVPPHVFGLDERALRYARVERRNGSLELAAYRSDGLEGDLFSRGPMGGSLREGAVLGEHIAGLVAAAGEVAEASLVLPDRWLRLAFIEAGELPRTRVEREEILRWQLRRLVPFRVEDLRLDEIEVPPLSSEREARRLLVLFGFDPLLTQLEQEFARRGVRLGHLSNQSLSLLAAVGGSLEALDLAAVVQVADDGYTILFLRGGVPAVYRNKVAAAGQPPSLLERDLRLTRTYLANQLDDSLRLRRMLLACPRQRQGEWVERLEDVFQVSVSPLGDGWSSETTPAPEPSEVAPLLGAASRSMR